MLLVGWGKGAKQIAYLGVYKCSNCKNYSHFHLYELANKIKLYFIQVAKFNKKYIIACETCEAGHEIDEETKNNLLQISVEIPNRDGFIEIWNYNDERLIARIKIQNNLDDKWFEHIINETRDVFCKRFNISQINHVIKKYAEFFQDEDRPK